MSEQSRDSVDGTDRAPDRYTKAGRETVDRMRDAAYAAVEAHVRKMIGERIDALPMPDLTLLEGLACEFFAFACETHALKYRDRAGHKGSLEDDLNKGRFYSQMAEHIRSGGKVPDPRHLRADFAPYARQPYPSGHVEVEGE